MPVCAWDLLIFRLQDSAHRFQIPSLIYQCLLIVLSSLFIHYCLLTTAKRARPPVALILGMCPACGHCYTTIWLFGEKKSKRSSSPLIALCSHAILPFPHTSLTSLHTLDQLLNVCVCVLERGHHKVVTLPHQEASIYLQTWPAS